MNKAPRVQPDQTSSALEHICKAGSDTSRSIKSLDVKLGRIAADPHGCNDFIIADAKDADMAFGVTAPGPNRSGDSEVRQSRWKSVEDYRVQIREIVAQGLVDIILLSASNLEQLAHKENLFKETAVTPAARANDTSDIWCVRGGRYSEFPSRSFRTATIDHIMHGRLGASVGSPVTGADLGLYSITFNNNIEWDYVALQEYQAFRREAELKGFRHFLEVFNPNVDPGIPPDQIPFFVNDHIVRTLAGVTEKGRPIFLKIPYNGPAALEELVAYDSRLVVGVLGGSAGTTFDAFKLIADAKRYGARVALFGRKINASESPTAFIRNLRRVVDEKLDPAEAVRIYHGELQKLRISPLRDLKTDLTATQTQTHY